MVWWASVKGELQISLLTGKFCKSVTSFLDISWYLVCGEVLLVSWQPNFYYGSFSSSIQSSRDNLEYWIHFLDRSGLTNRVQHPSYLHNKCTLFILYITDLSSHPRQINSLTILCVSLTRLQAIWVTRHLKYSQSPLLPERALLHTLHPLHEPDQETYKPYSCHKAGSEQSAELIKRKWSNIGKSRWKSDVTK